MYQLRVYHPGERTHAFAIPVKSAGEALELIPQLLKDHDGCERISVIAGGSYLFSVDCKGQRLDRDLP